MHARTHARTHTHTHTHTHTNTQPQRSIASPATSAYLLASCDMVVCVSWSAHADLQGSGNKSTLQQSSHAANIIAPCVSIKNKSNKIITHKYVENQDHKTKSLQFLNIDVCCREAQLTYILYTKQNIAYSKIYTYIPITLRRDITKSELYRAITMILLYPVFRTIFFIKSDLLQTDIMDYCLSLYCCNILTVINYTKRIVVLDVFVLFFLPGMSSMSLASQ